MQTLKNAIKIYRGESFTIDKIVKNEDGTPYIVPKLNNPYFLLSISNSVYTTEEGRTIYNYWLPVPRTFTMSTPVKLSEIGATKFSDITSFPYTFVSGSNMYVVDADYAVFTDGIEYKYWSNGWNTYECRITLPFSSDDTRNWNVLSYLYSIQLVSGMTNNTYLRLLCTDNSLKFDASSNNETLYDKLISVGIVFPADYSHTQPLGRIEMSRPILAPTELKVVNYTQGDIVW